MKTRSKRLKTVKKYDNWDIKILVYGLRLDDHVYDSCDVIIEGDEMNILL